MKSIKRPERLRVIESVYGKINTEEKKSIFVFELDIEARTFFSNYVKLDGTPLSSDRITECINRASLFNAIRNAYQRHRDARARYGKRPNKGLFWSRALDWHTEKSSELEVKVYTNPRSLERAYKEYLNDNYMSLIHKNEGNDSARRVSVSVENLFLALWRTNDHPFISRVHELYLEFVSGTTELFDRSTGEVFRPDDFRHKGRALEVSEATVWNYLKDVVNETAVYADRNGNFNYANSRRPKHHRKLGRYSLSKISMDDVALSRKSVRGFVYKYIAVDVVSGYYFRPAYVVGKPTISTVIESFRNMFCELSELDLPMPGELEVEHHLMKDIDWLNELFPFVRFCQSPTEKRAEHNIKSLKYGTAKREGHTRGRWYAKHEAWRTIRNKVSGDFVEPEFQPQTIIADDLADIEKHNNELHPLQKTYPGMTRKEVLLKHANPSLSPVEHRYLYKFIGNNTDTSIYNNDYCPVANEQFELVDFKALKRLKPNNKEVTAYWLPNENGSVDRVYLYQGDIYIGEALNRKNFDYNECAIERTTEDSEKILHQSKRLAKFDKTVKDRKADIPKIGAVKASNFSEYKNIPIEIIETEQPKGLDDFETEEFEDWTAKAISNL